MLLRKILRGLLYIGPPVLWMGGLFAASTQLGEYHVTFRFVQDSVQWLAPGTPRIDIDSMYGINIAVRKLAHVIGYGFLTVLLVRAIQYGQARLKPVSVFVALLLSVLFAIGDALHRRRVPGRHGDSADVVLDAIGIGIFFGGTLLYFGLKALERHLAQEPVPDTPNPQT